MSASLIASVSNGTLSFTDSGTFTYVHDGSETTTDTFIYRINDGLAFSSNVTVNITITPVSDPPITKSDTLNVFESGTVTLTSAGSLHY